MNCLCAYKFFGKVDAILVFNLSNVDRKRLFTSNAHVVNHIHQTETILFASARDFVQLIPQRFHYTRGVL